MWLTNPSTAESGAKSDVTNAVNAALQEIWTAPLDHYRRASGTFNTVNGTASYAMAASVQSILTPVKIGTLSLRPFEHRSNFDHYGTRFLGSTTDPPTSAQPEAFYVERKKATSGNDLSAVNILLTPTPDAVYTVSYDYVAEAPRYTDANMASTTVLAFPHEYVESILLPIAKHYLTESHWFAHWDANETAQKSADTQGKYAPARAMLGLTDPNVPSASKTKEESR